MTMQSTGLKFERVLSAEDCPVREQVQWKTVPVRLTAADGRVIFEMPEVEVPASWSETATIVMAQKYFRKRGVPSEDQLIAVNESGVPSWLWRHELVLAGSESGGETSAHQVFHRLAGCWTYWGWKHYFASEEDAMVFYDEAYLCLARQVAMPNSPQFFNTGLHWAYGIVGPDSGQWMADSFIFGVHPSQSEPKTHRIYNSYERPQPHACFLTSVKDDLVNPGGIMDLWVREARIFKHGSGSGTNLSAIRAKGERLSGGGVASGAMSWLSIGDRAAGSIASGGTTRRAALLRLLDIDHPEIEDFVNLKVKEEGKVAALFMGGRELACLAADLETGIKIGVQEEIPQAVLDRIAQGILPEEYDLAMEGEAYRTVNGQNANNSVRILKNFWKALENDDSWNLTARITGEVMKQVKARDLWNQICRAAWACADPGLHFADTVNEWNTCAVDGEITTSNPCQEFLHLCGTEYGSSACNLASARLTAFLCEDGSLDVHLMEHVFRLWTVVLDISVTMASFPAEEFALGAYNYRTIGLGYADLGGLLMRRGVPYDSIAGRALAAQITSLMTGVAYRTSAELAVELGEFPRWKANEESMRRVLRNHARAASEYTSDAEYEGLSYLPVKYHNDQTLRECDLYDATIGAWEVVINARAFRNAQVTLLAPTGTIALVMDCDTTGVEPDFALVKHKSLAGGGDVTIVNRAVPVALERLGYSPNEISAIIHDLKRNGGNVYDCPYVHSQHRVVFDCAQPPGGTDQCVSPMGHVLMVAAVQPFLSGSVSKTVNLPATATISDVSKVYQEAHNLGLKAIAIYRDGSKLAQPLRAAVTNYTVEGSQDRLLVEEARVTPAMNITALPFSTKAHSVLERGVRERLPARRVGGITQEVQIGEHKLFLTMNPYPDGRLGEVFLELAKEGSTTRALGNLVAMMMSLGLQYGVPAERYARMLRHLRFEPAGVVEGHDRIKMVSSIADYLAREIAISFLGEDDAGQIVPAASVDTSDKVVALDRRVISIVTSGYTGDICPECDNATLRPAGNCLRCDTCGSTTGCG